MPVSKQIDLSIESELLTSGSAAELTIAILELLLFQRNQIPFVYKTYKYYVTSWTEEHKEATEESQDLASYELQRQRELAKSTRDSISAMRQLILKSFEGNTVKTVRFLLGATAFTPKEAYTIHIPMSSIATKHSNEHHQFTAGKLNQILISLLTNEHLYGIFSHSLPPTNTYLEFETVNNDDSVCLLSEQLSEKEYCPLTASCKDIHIHLKHSPPADFDKNSLKCCQELEVFEDLNDTELKINHNTDTETENSLSSVIENVERIKMHDLSETSWWESDIIVRGFKQKIIKGASMWTK